MLSSLGRTESARNVLWIGLDSLVFPMKLLFALPGLHRFDRGAEVALLTIATELANRGNSITLIGSGPEKPSVPYRYLRANSVRREYFEHFPKMPILRNEYLYEELTFLPALWWNYVPSEYDATITCSYPFTNWLLRRPAMRGQRPPHVFITQNGDWPAHANNSEYRFFGCEGLVCTNPDFYERNKDRWNCRLIPNGVDVEKFTSKVSPAVLSFPDDRLIVLMVSALIPTKRVCIGIEAVSKIPNAHLVVAGDGPLREEVDAAASRLLPKRFTRLSVPAEAMPSLYQAADVFLHLSKEESFGNVFLEAMASGLPIVGHDSQRLRWIVGDNEHLLDTEDTTAVAAAISAAANENSSRSVERSKRAALFSWPRITDLYEGFLMEIAERTRNEKPQRPTTKPFMTDADHQ